MTQLNEAHIVRFFTRMQHLYAHKWERAYGPAIVGEGHAVQLSPSAQQWLADLADYSAEQILVGLAALQAKRLEWPPGPLEFMDLCDEIPSIDQVLDRENDYGAVCAAIRGRMDWYRLEAMSATEAQREVARRRETVLMTMRRNGGLQQLSVQRATALAQERAAQNKLPKSASYT